MIRIQTKRDALKATLFLAFIIVLLFLMAPTYRGANGPASDGLTIARLKYTIRPDQTDPAKGYYTDADTPSFEDNLCSLLARLMRIQCTFKDIVYVEPSSKELFKYPLVIMEEPEQAIFSDKDVANMREWLARGGTLMVEDFHGDEDFGPALAQLEKLRLEGWYFSELKTNHAMFHVFYDLDEIVQAVNDTVNDCRPQGCPQYENGDSGRFPHVFAFSDDAGYPRIVMNFNNDCGDGIQWLDKPDYDLAMSKYCIKFYTNQVLWHESH